MGADEQVNGAPFRGVQDALLLLGGGNKGVLGEHLFQLVRRLHGVKHTLGEGMTVLGQQVEKIRHLGYGEGNTL